MTKNLFAAVIAVGTLTIAGAACAQDFPAAPLNPGPLKVTGLGPVSDLANVALIPGNTLASPIATLPTAGAATAEAPAPKHHRHHRRHLAKR